MYTAKIETQIKKMANTTKEINTEDREDSSFLDFKNRKKFIEKEICDLDDEECLSCGS
jgi:hypothetical protein|tara:strand:+ start:203 stop:376 length:174 start_codon:yes stop_codon:yes gene_type:complete